MELSIRVLIVRRMCKAHDFQKMRWHHLNFFQHHCYLTARVPRVDCPQHGIHRTEVPWSRNGSGFTLLFEQVIMALPREMPVNAIARYVGVIDKRIWRIIGHYVRQAMNQLDLSELNELGLDETVSKCGYNYVTVSLDMERDERPVIFTAPDRAARRAPPTGAAAGRKARPRRAAGRTGPPVAGSGPAGARRRERASWPGVRPAAAP